MRTCPRRNSNLEAWTAFARSLDPTRFMPVFVPDLEQTLNGQLHALQGHPVLGEAAWNLGLRMALYERSYISLGVNTGPMGLCWLNARTHYATLKMAPENVPQTSRRSTSSLASSLNARCLLPRRRRNWFGRTIRCAAIQRAFARIAERLESGARAPECMKAAARDASLDNAPTTS